MIMKNKHIQYVVDDQVGVVTLNRPESRNAITTEMWIALPAVLKTLQSDGARVIVITGSGEAFAAGADLDELNQLQTYEQAAAFWLAIETCLNSIWQFNLPVIAMINGACVGGGCLLATACDLRYAASSASFAIPVARLGIILDDDSIMRLTGIVGDAFARELLFTGMTVNSVEAARRGLINAVYDDLLLEPEVMRTAHAVVRNESSAVAETKRAFGRIRLNLKPDDKQRDLIINSYLSSELRERVGAVLQALRPDEQ
jgi:enoyl-CoA hydratase